MVLESRVLLARLEKILDMMLRGAPLVALMSHLLIIGSLVVLNLMLSSRNHCDSQIDKTLDQMTPQLVDPILEHRLMESLGPSGG